MEKPARTKSKIFSFLPKVASVAFQNPPYSPGRDKTKASIGKGFSGPIISIIPAEARRKSKNGSFDAQEPTSPKVSCIGQIKHKKKTSSSKPSSPFPQTEKKKTPSSSSSSAIRNIFHGAKPGRKSDAYAGRAPIPDKVPSLGQMKQFASSRGALANFDWTGHDRSTAANHRNYNSDEESGGEDEVIIPFSAPMVLGGGMATEPRKEVNLWKRRTMALPMPLQLNKTAKQ